MFAYDEEFDNEFNIEYDCKKNKPERHVMTKEEFVTKAVADLAARKEKRIAVKAKQELESKTYIINKMIYNRKKRNRR